jgi:hypothetical protein
MTRTLTLQRNKNLEAKVYSKNILLMNVSKMQKTLWKTMTKNQTDSKYLAILQTLEDG